MSGLGVVHLLYKVGPPTLVQLFTHTSMEMFGSDIGEPYKSVQELYENAFHCRLFDMAW